jgi:hypothetical protein
MVETLSTGVLVAGMLVAATDGVGVETVVDITGDSIMVGGTGAGDRPGFTGVFEDVHPVDRQKQQIIRHTTGYTKPFRDFMLFYLSVILKMCRPGIVQG